MNIVVNNKPQVTEQNQTITGLLAGLALSGAKGIAVAINLTIVPKMEWDNHVLHENDQVTIIRATQGG